MSKRGYISRYLLILKKLRASPYCSYGDLELYIADQLDFLQLQDDRLNIGFSKRTFQRDIREIRNVFGIDIEYSSGRKGYYISQSESENMNFQRMMESFDLFSSLNIAKDLSSIIQLEKRKPQGTENIYGILHAIKNRFQVRFSYHKFWEEESSQRQVDPYALKEFKDRWYIVVNDCNDNSVKSFALDRISNLEILKTKFKYPEKFSVDDYYRYCFGIIGPGNDLPQNIILSFTPFQGKYIKTLPLHQSQEILVDDDNELRVQLRLHITHDLVMELLSYGDNLKVLEPKELAIQMKKAHENAAKQYEVAKSS